MRESSGYQMILAEGRLEEARKLLLILGESKFGSPDHLTAAALNAINDIEQLELLAKRLIEINSWQELFHRPAPPARIRRNK